MTYSVAQAPPFQETVIWPGAWCSIGGIWPYVQVVPTSQIWPTAAKAYYFPFVLQSSATVYQVGWINGSGTMAGTSEVGVYDAGGTKIISGSAAQATISVAQFVNVTDTLLGPGRYWLAGVNSLNTGTYMAQNPTAPSLAAMGVLTQTSAQPLPATATFALDQATSFTPAIFLQMRATM